MTFSGYANAKDKLEKRIAILMLKKGIKALLGWEDASERIIWVRFKARYIIVINVYALTNENRDEKNALNKFKRHITTKTLNIKEI